MRLQDPITQRLLDLGYIDYVEEPPRKSAGLFRKGDVIVEEALFAVTAAGMEALAK